jgi:histidinol phosphatase-like enzyme (inositol monophosphatase family)
MSELAVFAAFAGELADAARAEALRWSEADWAVENKNEGGDFDPVTRADRAVERVMRDLIEARWPDHGIAGEEFGVTRAGARWTWSLDPIDGTRAFICGLPSWTVLIALLDEGRPVLGVIDVPRLGERFLGHGDIGAFVTAASEAPLRTSGCQRLADSRIATTDPYLFKSGEREAFDRVRERARLTRYGFDAYAYGRVAAGGLDLVIESGLAPHDLNALIPVVTAAGGAVSNWRGESDFTEGSIVAAASQALLDEALEALRG